MLELIFVKLLEISIQASFFILAVMLIRFCFKRLPKRYVCILWALVAVRLILPFEITSSFSLVPDTSRVLEWADAETTLNIENKNSTQKSISAEAIDQNTWLAQNDLAQNNMSQIDLTNPAQTNTAQNNQVPTGTVSSALSGTNLGTNAGTMDASTNSITANTTTLTLAGLFTRIWLIGSIALLTYGIISYLRLKSKLRTAVHVQDNIWHAEQIPSPFVLGYIKPRIYVPFSIREEQMPYIIAHEQAHISHLDHLSKLLAALLLSIYWFNPFIWAAYLLYCKDLELACDERVIGKLGNEEKKPYSEALLICSVTNKALLQSPLAFSEVAVKDRIVNILNYKKPGFWGIVAAVVICIMAGVCFLTSSEPAQTKTSEFIEQTTAEMLDQVTLSYQPDTAFSELPDTVGPDAYCIINAIAPDNIQMYGLINGEAMILRDGDTLYPLYDIQWPTYDANDILMKIYKSDYDSDGTEEYALNKIEYDESGAGFLGITMLEAKETTLTPIYFTLKDIRTQLQRITFEYVDEEQSTYVYIDDELQTILDVSWVNEIYDQSSTEVLFNDTIYFEEIDGQWEIFATASFIPEKEEYDSNFVAASFRAPVTYFENGTFQLGDISIEYINTDTPPLLDIYANQLAAFPGEAKLTDEGQLITSVFPQDYDCRVVTDPDTGKTVYIWPFEERTSYAYLTPTYPTKDYPLEIVDGKVQEVPARILTETAVSSYDFGADVLSMTYKIHPYGTKQYILRDNGTLNVNIGYEAADYLAFQYLTFQISDDGKTAALSDFGSGYYLLQLNNVDALEAFRETYTGEGHTLPSDTAHLPWEWLLALNGEKNDAPDLKQSELPDVNRSYDFFSFDHYNYYDWFHGFTVSEKNVNGETFAEYLYQDDTDYISLLTDIHTYEVVSITYNGEEKPLPEQPLIISAGGAGTYYSLYYVDVTGDSQKELIFEDAGGGTGFWYSNCYVFNPNTMEQYTFDKDVSPLTYNLKVTLTEFDPEDKRLHYLLEYENLTAEASAGFDTSSQENASIMQEGVTLEAANEHFCHLPETTAERIAYNPETGCIEANIWLYIQHTTIGTYIGYMNVAYTLDEAAGEFVIDLNTVKLEGNSW